MYCVPDLAKAVAEFAQKTGVKPTYGGRHLRQGTHNALLKIGDKMYLEFLAIDPENQDVPPPRWMGIDLLTTPKITRWALHSDDIERDKKILPADLAVTHAAQRQTAAGDLLHWQMTLPLPSPEVELLPFFINWKAVHPTDNLMQEMQLEKVEFGYPKPAEFQQFELQVEQETFHAKESRIRVHFAGEKGEIIL